MRRVLMRASMENRWALFRRQDLPLGTVSHFRDDMEPCSLRAKRTIALLPMRWMKFLEHMATSWATFWTCDSIPTWAKHDMDGFTGTLRARLILILEKQLRSACSVLAFDEVDK